MNSNKKIVAILFAGLSAVAFNASAIDFGALKGGNKDSGNAENDIKAFVQTADTAHALTSKSVLVLGEALLTKAEMQVHADNLAAASKMPEGKERDAAMAKVNTDMQAQLAKVDFEQQGKELAKSNDKKKNAQVGASMYNFVLALLKDKELIAKGNSLVASASSNPMLLTKMGKVKDVVSSVSGQIENMGKIANGLYKLNTTLKMVTLPTAASAAPKESAD